MSIPTHTIYCYTKAYPTSCPDCKQPVWFFSCTCGSKVFFDALGSPWRIHECTHRTVREAIEMLRLSDRLTDSELYARIDQYASEHDYEIPDHIADVLENELGRRKIRLFTIPIDDLSGFTDISGKVMEINKMVSFRSRLKIDLDSPLSVGLAADLLKHEFAEVVLRENPDERNRSREFRVFIKSKLFKQHPLTVGNTLLGIIAPIKNKLKEFWELIEYKIY